MTLEATRMALKAKLADKGRLRPHEMIRKKMPDGTGSLQDLPMRAHGAAAEDEAAEPPNRSSSIELVGKPVLEFLWHRQPVGPHPLHENPRRQKLGTAENGSRASFVAG
jgi:hypothetical protein